ncbi:SpaH/EbpB family LPXTG-anchored major pilin [Pseudarthrobacter sp. J1763]|uniref:SpaH/EbpB family LPXTG-anchored major pilin n=1 Tax=Pseudarthrobacter sp. J1763 TaxID=3420445 RepID=UPI003D2C52C1
MSSPRKTLTRRVTAGLGIAGIAAAAMLGSVAPASAAPGPGNINPDAPKSLTIHKFEQPATEGTPPDGTVQNTNGLTKLVGVKFKIQEVTNIDLSTNAGWAATEGLTPGDVSAANLGAATELATDANGVATFTGLKQAVYLVTETDRGANNIAFAAKPFLVTLPLPKASDNTWIYDVHVYPKNSLTTLEKSIDDTNATGLGSDVTWNIAVGIPAKSEGNTLDSYLITDQLDSRLTFKSATVVLNGATLVEGTDYTLSTTGGVVVIDFNSTGLGKLAAAAGSTVSVALATTVTSVGDGAITNKAQSFINGTDPAHTFDSNTVQTTWGNVLIHKVGKEDTTKNLQGAEFQVYASEADAKAGTNPIAVNGVSTFTSGEDGIAKIDGLRATLNGGTTPIDYWLVETKAPAGYQIALEYSQANPVKFNVTPGTATEAAMTVEDPQIPPFTLPLTGGSGNIMFMAAGLGLLSIAGGAVIWQRAARRKTVTA